jgi:SAM-dependent methyltransferase
MMPADLRDSRDRMMVDVHIAGRGIRDLRVLAAMRRVPREAFVDADLEEFAYEDNPLPMAEQQTISQPYIVALMVEAAEIGRQDRVLEIGAGSGYAAAVAAQLAKKVYAIERHASLVLQAAERFRKLGYSNVELRQGDGTLGWPDDGSSRSSWSPQAETGFRQCELVLLDRYWRAANYSCVGQIHLLDNCLLRDPCSPTISNSAECAPRI